RANGKTSGAKRLLSRLQRLLIQAADGDARALSVEFLRCGQSDPAVAAGDKDILVRKFTHCRLSFRLKMSVSVTVHILPIHSVPTETLLPLARFACGETTTTSPSCNPCFISMPVSVSWPRTMPTRCTIPSRTVHT